MNNETIINIYRDSEAKIKYRTFLYDSGRIEKLMLLGILEEIKQELLGGLYD